eukprot:6958971-Prymnesium_polylepis.2
MPIDIDYDEDVGNPARPECYINISRNEELYRATERAMPYKTPADGDATRAVVSLLYFEKLFRKCEVEDPSNLDTVNSFTRCLHLTDFIKPALDTLIANDLIPTDEDGATVPFESATQLQVAVDALVDQLKEDPTMKVTHNSWDHYEQLSAATATFGWLDAITLQELTQPTNNLTCLLYTSPSPRDAHES